MEIEKTYQDNEEIGKVIDKKTNIKCKYQYVYDSGDYLLEKCSHKKHPTNEICIGINCKKRKKPSIISSIKSIKNCIYYSYDKNTSTNTYHKCCIHGIFVGCKLYYKEIKSCSD